MRRGGSGTFELGTSKGNKISNEQKVDPAGTSAVGLERTGITYPWWEIEKRDSGCALRKKTRVLPQKSKAMLREGIQSIYYSLPLRKGKKKTNRNHPY